MQRAELNRIVFDYRNEAYLLICAFDKIDDFRVFDPQDVDFLNDLNQGISSADREIVIADLGRYASLLEGRDDSFDSTESAKISELKYILEGVLGVLTPQRAYILYLAVWSRF